jgi:hypothetical protein
MTDSRKTCGMSERTDITAITGTGMLMREGSFKILSPILVLIVICFCALPIQAKYGGATGEPDKNDWIITCEQQSLLYRFVIETIEYIKNVME